MLRLASVAGYNNRLNDILFTKGSETSSAKGTERHVIFFPGDIQVGTDNL